MAKISPVSIKYIIHAKLEATGAVEKPDIIGAIFGQTEGLLGDDMEMRELQKSGKIGRIEVNTSYGGGNTTGEIEVPSAMDKTETTLLAAALETIERVGPSDTKIAIEEIEDVRGSKRDYILERAKKLMEKLGDASSEISEMTSEIQDSTRIAKMQTYGTENLPCGDISGDELIIVEGRADVITLLKNGIKNTIAMNGAKLPDTVVELTKEKPEVILFVDGDRGGELIIKNVSEVAKIDFIAIAPDGKEVEELMGKEILQALRKKVPTKDYRSPTSSRGRRYSTRDSSSSRSSSSTSSSTSSTAQKKTPKEVNRKKLTPKEKEKIQSELDNLIGTKGAILFNKDLERTSKVPLNKLSTLNPEDPYVVAIDGTATPRVIETCETMGCHNLIATNFVFSDTDVNLVSM